MIRRCDCLVHYQLKSGKWVYAWYMYFTSMCQWSGFMSGMLPTYTSACMPGTLPTYASEVGVCLACYQLIPGKWTPAMLRTFGIDVSLQQWSKYLRKCMHGTLMSVKWVHGWYIIGLWQWRDSMAGTLPANDREVGVCLVSYQLIQMKWV